MGKTVQGDASCKDNTQMGNKPKPAKDITTIVLQRNADQNHNETLHHWGDQNKSMYNYKHWQRHRDWKAHSSIHSTTAATFQQTAQQFFKKGQRTQTDT